MDSYDVVVIGAGNAGQGAAGVCAAAGKTTCIVEARDVGGTCPLRGCVPKKVLVAASERIRDELGWEPRKPELETMIADAWAWAQAHPDGYAV